MQGCRILYMAYGISRCKGDEPQELVGSRKCVPTCIARVSEQHTIVHTRMCSAEPGTNTTSRDDPP